MDAFCGRVGEAEDKITEGCGAAKGNQPAEDGQPNTIEMSFADKGANALQLIRTRTFVPKRCLSTHKVINGTNHNRAGQADTKKGLRQSSFDQKGHDF